MGRPVGSGKAIGPREVVIVEIETASRIVGMGHIMPIRGGLETIAACLRELIVPRILGRDATQIEAIWHDLYRATYTVGRMGVAIIALSTVDIALWDALGKKAGLPLHRLWGNFRNDIPIYGSGCWRDTGAEGMVQKAREYVAAGMKAIKMQVGHTSGIKTDVENVRRMREALGPDITIMLDATMAWTADQAIEAGLKFEPYDIYWFEEPVTCEDFRGYFRVAEKLNTRIVGGEKHFTRYDLRPFFENPNIAVLNPDVMRGGLTELRKIAVLADTWGLTISPHLAHELMVHVMASIPNGLIMEYMDFLDDVWVEPVLPQGPIVRVPERPGHGMAFKQEILRDYAVKI
jgi:L-alanine-DL-glutamate epimerase-like enolase superfamily enzyme